jgi:hypothetical protein
VLRWGMANRRRRGLVVATVVLLLGGGLAVAPRLLWGDGVDYSQVTSIEKSATYQDPALLAEAWQLPVAARYGREPFESQRNPSFCGPTSVVNLLHSLSQPAEQKTILDGTGVSTVFGLVPGGVTLDKLAQVVREKSGKRVTVLRGLDLAAFRAELAKSNDPARRYLVNFHRGPLFGRGGGHHSPVGGYLPARDLVFVLDVNQDFQPWLIERARLYAAMNTLDGEKKRGLLLIE